MYSNLEIEKFKEKEFERRERELVNAVPQQLSFTNNIMNKLHIVYVMTWTGICGGSKIILEHANKLTDRGHNITIITHDNKPNWFPLNSKVEFIQVPWGEVLGEKIPNCDLIITTYWREIYECIEQKKAPVVYFEQGDYHLFELEKLEERKFNFIKKQFETVQFIYTVSNFAKEKIKTIYNKEAEVIPNAVNNDIFFAEKNKIKNKNINIALIGSEDSEFKRIKNILEAIRKLQNEGYKIDINWITPTKPKNNDINAIVNPPQKTIGDVLRKSDIFICASIYESFCLPVLEAMSCGTSVITTNNGGNMDFVKENENALIIEKDNIEDICDKIKILYKDEKLREMLSKKAVETSKEYSWDKTINKIEKYYKTIARYKVIEGK